MAINLDHSWAQNMLGYCYQGGSGVKKNKLKALKLYGLAATKGYCKSRYILSDMFLCGDGIKNKIKEGIKWLIQAAQQDHWKAKENVGDIGRSWD